MFMRLFIKATIIVFLFSCGKSRMNNRVDYTNFYAQFKEACKVGGFNPYFLGAKLGDCEMFQSKKEHAYVLEKIEKCKEKDVSLLVRFYYRCEWILKLDPSN